MITTLSEDALLVLANRKPTYAMHRVKPLRLREVRIEGGGGYLLGSHSPVPIRR
jgi:hypothetical protein